jgi:hypothetical protein
MSTQPPGDTGHRETLRKALLELLEAARRGQAPTRHQARDLLLALGVAIRAEDGVEVGGAVESLRECASSNPRFRERWRAAVTDEMTLACTEHVRSADPRYLDPPRYDFEYTISARDRLELRLRAAEKLGLSPDARWMEQVARADELLARSLARRSRGSTHRPD